MHEQQPSPGAQLRELLRNTQYSPEQIAEIVMHTLYPKLSMGAVNTYRQLGRGAVFMDLRDLDRGELNTSYVSQEQVFRLNIESGLFDEAEQAIASYDPEREFVAILWQHELLLTYRLPQI
ncbi:MAG TPA: hypothetical protein VFS21_13920 [Roseiflexaceae bacterium]|nr:hypothetical protein [Roseiflexaceae bacterium]